MSAEPVLLVMGSGDQLFREYLLSSIARRGPVWLFDAEHADWTTPYRVGSTVLDVFDPTVAVAAARTLAEQRPVRGVCCYAEGVIISAARVAAALGVPGSAPEAVAAARDKNVSRGLLDHAGLPQPRYALVTTLDQARAVAETTIGYPLVSKPCGLGASQGVVKVDSAAQLPEAMAVTRAAGDVGMVNGGEVLLEEYVAGPEISIDAAIFDGEYLPYLLARKRIGFAPFFEEIGHTVTADDPLLTDEKLQQLLADVHRALGWHHGLTHTEVKLTERGPVIIEVNGRSGGDLIPYLGELGLGVDTGDVTVDLALGVRPRLTVTWSGTTAIRFLYPPRDCRVREVRMPAPGVVPGLLESIILAAPGTELRLPPGGYVARYGALIAQGADARQCESIIDDAAQMATFEFDPLVNDGAGQPGCD